MRSARAAAGWALLVGATAWVAAIIAAPYVVSHSDPGTPMFAASGIVYAIGSIVCHQMADRSFHLAGAQLAVCARCTGLYLLAPAGVALALVQAGRWRRRSSAGRVRSATVRWLLLAAAAPTMATVAAEAVGLGTWSNMARAVAGLPVGLVVAWTAAMATRGALTDREVDWCVRRAPRAGRRP